MLKDTNPKDAIGTKKWRQFFVVPRQVLWEVGVGMLEGALKYGRHNYRASGVRASVYCDAATGHIEQFIEGEDVDKDSGLSHITKAICSLVVLRDAMLNDFWTDDRPPKIKDLDALRDRLQKTVEENFERYKDKSPHHYTEEEDGAPYRQTVVIIDEVSDIDPRWFDAVAHSAVEPPVPGRVPVWVTREEMTVIGEMLKSGEMQKRIDKPVKELKTDQLEIGKWYRPYRLPNGEVAAADNEDLEPWKIIDTRKVDGTKMAVRRGWDADHKGVPLSRSHTWVEVDDWNATLTDVQDEENLSTASAADLWAIGLQPVIPGEVVEKSLADPNYLPTLAISDLSKWDPSNWVKLNSTHPDYDREHVVDALTQCQLDRLVREEAQRCGVVVSEAPSDVEMWNALCRRVLLRLMTRHPLWHTIDFATGGTGRRYSRLRGEEWFVAIPGCRVTPDPMPRTFA